MHRYECTLIRTLLPSHAELLTLEFCRLVAEGVATGQREAMMLPLQSSSMYLSWHNDATVSTQQSAPLYKGQPYSGTSLSGHLHTEPRTPFLVPNILDCAISPSVKGTPL